jgi:hypothetical protein
LGDVADLRAAILQLVEAGTEISPPLGDPTEHSDLSATDRYRHGCLLGFATAWKPWRQAH